MIYEWIKGCRESVASRVSEVSAVQALYSAFAAPIFSTSVHQPGEEEIRSRLILDEKFAAKIAFIADRGISS